LAPATPLTKHSERVGYPAKNHDRLFGATLGFATPFEKGKPVTSIVEDVGGRIADLLVLLAAAQKSLAKLNEDRSAEAQIRRVRLHATIDTVKLELAKSRRALDRASRNG
jgi:hypothetical protein